MIHKRLCRRWTKEEIIALKKAICVEAKATTEIGTLSRSKYSIYQKAFSLGLLGEGVSRRPWKAEHKAKLIELRKQGLFTKQIVDILPYNANAIQLQIKRLGISSRSI